MSNAKPTDEELFDLLREIHHKVTKAEDMYVSIDFPEPQRSSDKRPREIMINRHKLPRVGEYITWNDYPYDRSRVTEVHHGFPSHTSRHAHTVTLVVEDVPRT